MFYMCVELQYSVWFLMLKRIKFFLLHFIFGAYLFKKHTEDASNLTI